MKRIAIVLFIFFIGYDLMSQSLEPHSSGAQPWEDLGQIHGDFQSDFQTYKPDSIINAPVVPEKMGSNNYLNLNYYRGNLSAGLRLETYQPALQGYDPRFRGTGIPYKFITYKFDDLEVTAGNFYEQFGNGLILRTYWDWGLGFDNSIEGFRIKYSGIRGVYLKGLIGKQRYYFDKGEGTVRGFDGEINLFELLGETESTGVFGTRTKTTTILIGGSFVSKYQKDDNPILTLPENVPAFAARTSISGQKLSFQAEYAYKYNDPAQLNNYTFKNGEALFIATSYSVKGLGISLGAKRIDNMNYRSERGASLPNDLLINYMPALTPQHTYRLATLYPYASQPNGEIGFQADVSMKIPAQSFFGGEYGTKLNFNYSHTNGIIKTPMDSTELAVWGNQFVGYRSGLGRDVGFKNGSLVFGEENYYRNLSGEVNKKFNDRWKGIFSYIYIEMNDAISRLSLSGYGKMIYAQIAVADVSWKFSPRKTIRVEAQHLNTEQDYGNWATGLVELTLGHKWSFSVLDDYNYGNPEDHKKVHYLSGNFSYTKNTTRISISYGKRRAGVLCVGGVCRLVPATNGLTLNLSSSF